MHHGQGPANAHVAEQLRPHLVLPGTTRFVFLSARAVWEFSKNQLFLSVDGRVPLKTVISVEGCHMRHVAFLCFSFPGILDTICKDGPVEQGIEPENR